MFQALAKDTIKGIQAKNIECAYFSFLQVASKKVKNVGFYSMRNKIQVMVLLTLNIWDYYTC